MNLRQLAAEDTRNLNITDWGLPVEFIAPDGEEYKTDAVTGETLKAVQILYNRRKLNMNTGEEVLVNEPIVVMARKSMARIPQDGETWLIKFPLDPEDPDTLSNFILSGVRAQEGTESLNVVRFYPQKAVQSA